jgi:hypothetical protein
VFKANHEIQAGASPAPPNRRISNDRARGRRPIFWGFNELGVMRFGFSLLRLGYFPNDWAIFHISAARHSGRSNVNGTRMTRMSQIISDKTQKVRRQSALSASSAFYQLGVFNWLVSCSEQLLEFILSVTFQRGD